MNDEHTSDKPRFRTPFDAMRDQVELEEFYRRCRDPDVRAVRDAEGWPMTDPLNKLPSAPPEKERSAGQSVDHPSAWPEVWVDGRRFPGRVTMTREVVRSTGLYGFGVYATAGPVRVELGPDQAPILPTVEVIADER